MLLLKSVPQWVGCGHSPAPNLLAPHPLPHSCPEQWPVGMSSLVPPVRSESCRTGWGRGGVLSGSAESCCGICRSHASEAGGKGVPASHRIWCRLGGVRAPWEPPHPLSPSLQQEDQEREGFSTNPSCRWKPCAPSEAPIALCGKRGDNVLEIEIYFSVFSET